MNKFWMGPRPDHKCHLIHNYLHYYLLLSFQTTIDLPDTGQLLLPRIPELLCSLPVPILVVKAREKIPHSCSWTPWGNWGSTRVTAVFLVQINLMASVKAEVGTLKGAAIGKFRMSLNWVFIFSVRDNSD